MRAHTAILTMIVATFLVGPAAAYGPKGHQMIGAVADTRLSKAAKAAVAKNLGYPLRTAANWADCVKDVEKSNGKFVYNPDPRFSAACKVFATAVGKDRMISYARRNWDNCTDPAMTKGCHALYHFADVPIQQDHYDRLFTGTSNHDIVSAIRAAVAMLQDQAVPEPFSIKDKAEAILMLSHLVGDLHQPLHVGAVYLDDHDLPSDPGPVSAPHDKKMDTRGGNQLEVGSSNLHANWDDILGSWDPLHLSKETISAAKAVPKTHGNVEDWPAIWASETVKTSQDAYAGLTFAHPGAKKTGDWVTAFPDRTAYLKQKNATQGQEMVVAGARLAQILNAVWP
jgi:hypothetical protein